MSDSQKEKSRLVRATKALQQIPFPLGDRTFYAKRLDGEEEILYEEAMGLQSLGFEPQETITNLVFVLKNIFRRREIKERETSVDTGWIEHYIGPNNVHELMAFLRTGHNGPGLVPRPDTTLDLPEVELEIEGRLFAGRCMGYAEYRSYQVALEAVQSASIDMIEGLPDDTEQLQKADAEATVSKLKEMGIRETIRKREQIIRLEAQKQRDTTQIIADMLNERIADGGEPISAHWLLVETEHSLKELEGYLNYFLTGKAPEADSPNADSAPENLPINA